MSRQRANLPILPLPARVQRVLLLTLALISALLAGCAPRERSVPELLNLASRPTFLYFYTPT